jgi:alpha-beta hydrolase superfamily lysophospholipase
MPELDSSAGEGSFIAFDGLGIYRRWWLPDGGTRAVIMLVHGLGEHSARYDHVAVALVDQGYAVHALDHRGHGRSGGKRTFVKSYDEFMRDLVDFREIVEAEHPDLPVVMLGHSMGGNLAMAHTLDHQDGLAGLALSGALLSVGDAVSPAQLKAIGLLARVAPGVRPQGLSADAISRDPAVVAAYRSDPLVYTGKISAGLLAALLGSVERFPDRYAELSLPVLVLHGTDDKLVDIAGSRELETAAVNAEVTVHYYDGLYHEVFNEPEHDVVIADLVSWLDQVTS